MVEAICRENCWAVSFQHGMKLFKFMTSILAVFTTNVLQFWMKENVIYFMYFLYSWLDQVIAIKEDIISYSRLAVQCRVPAELERDAGVGDSLSGGVGDDQPLIAFRCLSHHQETGWTKSFLSLQPTRLSCSPLFISSHFTTTSS